MTTAAKHGGPAFPISSPGGLHAIGAAALGVNQSPELREGAYLEAREKAAMGMTLRDYFAAKALPVAAERMITDGFNSSVGQFADLVAALSYLMADAMLAERAK